MKGTAVLLYMRRLLLVLIVCGVPAFAGTLSLAEYREQLTGFSHQTESLANHPEDSAKLLAAIPGRVSVLTHAREYSVSYQWLKDDLTMFQKAEAKTRAEILQRIRQHLEILVSESQVFENSPGNLEQPRAKLDQILSRREFKRVQGPGIWAIWRAKLYRWLDRLFQVKYGAGLVFDLLHILVYVVIGGTVLAV